MTNKTNNETTILMTCGNCDGGLDGSHLDYGLTCPACGIRVTEGFSDYNDVPEYLRVSTIEVKTANTEDLEYVADAIAETTRYSESGVRSVESMAAYRLTMFPTNDAPCGRTPNLFMDSVAATLDHLFAHRKEVKEIIESCRCALVREGRMFSMNYPSQELARRTTQLVEMERQITALQWELGYQLAGKPDLSIVDAWFIVDPITCV